MTTHLDSKFMTVSEDRGVLSLIWKRDTHDLTGEDFKTEALNFVEILKELQSKKILVDMRDFEYQLTESVIDWRNKHVISAYNEVGVTKFAFISDKPAVKQDNPDNTFVTQTFISMDEAVEWLKTE